MKCVSERRNEDMCWGRGAVMALLEDAPARVLKVYLSKTMNAPTYSRITELCRAAGVPFVHSDPKHIDEMTQGENHQGVAASVSEAEMLSLEDAISLLPPQPERALAVVFDHVQDPHNLGAMIRSAEAAGACFAAMPLRRGALPLGTVAKTSAGASLRLPLVSLGNVASSIRRSKEAGMWCVGLEADASRTIYSAGLSHRTLLVVGGEGSGLSRTVAAECDEVLSIPIDGRVGSLNVSVALGVAMFEWRRSNALL